MEELKKNPPAQPKRPAFPVKTVAVPAADVARGGNQE
jgi:hypothetical protein